MDQEGKRIHVYHPADGRRTSVPTQELTPAIILTQNPDVLVVPMEQVSNIVMLPLCVLVCVATAQIARQIAKLCWNVALGLISLCLAAECVRHRPQ